jgi:haloalkane dehalogenase
MKVLRTPDERFSGLVDFPYVPNYLDIDDQDGGTLRMHYLDEGPPDGELVLCMHGQPNWSYSFRKMIGPLSKAGFRVVVPDIVGFGRSINQQSVQITPLTDM